MPGVDLESGRSECEAEGCTQGCLLTGIGGWDTPSRTVVGALRDHTITMNMVRDRSNGCME